jgi:hypothetical protein
MPKASLPTPAVLHISAGADPALLQVFWRLHVEKCASSNLIITA